MKFKTYENEKFKVKIDYPEDWEVEKDIMAFLTPLESTSDRFKENINITLRKLPSDLALEDFTDISLTELEHILTNFELLEGPVETQLDGKRAHQIIFKAVQGIYSLRFMVLYTVFNDVGYILTYTAEDDKFDKYIDIISLMIDSFEITGTYKFEPSEFTHYKNKTFNIEIEYPSNWDVIKDGMVFLSPLEEPTDDFRENINISVQKLPSKMSLEEFSELNISELKKIITNFKIVEGPIETKLAGIKANQITFTAVQGKYLLKFMSICTIKNDNVYVITFTSEEDKYEKYLETVKKMIDSFKIL
ncbi:MAG: PsbP-related protein [Candidatus Helarchaeota archaeon]